MNRIQNQTVLITTPDEHDYQLRLRIVPVIPSLRGQHFAAKPVKLISMSDQASISTTHGLRESYGVTEQDAARACVDTIEKFLEARTKSVSA
jgi:hypothetical protein